MAAPLAQGLGDGYTNYRVFTTLLVTLPLTTGSSRSLLQSMVLVEMLPQWLPTWYWPGSVGGSPSWARGRQWFGCLVWSNTFARSVATLRNGVTLNCQIQPFAHIPLCVVITSNPIFIYIFNRPGVAGAVLHTASSLIHTFIH